MTASSVISKADDRHTENNHSTFFSGFRGDNKLNLELALDLKWPAGQKYDSELMLNLLWRSKGARRSISAVYKFIMMLSSLLWKQTIRNISC